MDPVPGIRGCGTSNGIQGPAIAHGFPARASFRDIEGGMGTGIQLRCGVYVQIYWTGAAISKALHADMLAMNGSVRRQVR